MTEISSISFEEPYYDNLKSDPPCPLLWQKVGRVVLWSSAFSGVSAFIPALVRKKRVYVHGSVPQAHAPPPEPVAVVIDGDAPLLKAPRCTAEEEGKIRKIFTTIAEGGLSLAWPATRRELERLGEEIDHVHPLEFLRCVPKNHLRTIFNETLPFKKDKVREGVAKNMERERTRNNLAQYIAGFAADMRTTDGAIRPLIQAGDWQGLVLHLIETSAVRGG